jgi:hypothetical protein
VRYRNTNTGQPVDVMLTNASFTGPGGANAFVWRNYSAGQSYKWITNTSQVQLEVRGNGNLYCTPGGAVSAVVPASGGGQIISNTATARLYLETLGGTAGRRVWGMFNDAGANGELRIGSLTDTAGAFTQQNVIVAHHATGYVGLGTATPNSKLHVQGAMSTAAQDLAVATTLTDAHSTVRVTAAATITLPTASAANTGRQYTVLRAVAVGSVTIASNAIDLVTGIATAATLVLTGAAGLRRVQLQSDGTAWRIIAIS